MNKLSLEELRKSGGGLIVKAKGHYWAVSDDGRYFAPIGYTTPEDAAEKARSFGYSTTFMSKEEFEAKFGEFLPFGQML